MTRPLRLSEVVCLPQVSFQAEVVEVGRGEATVHPISATGERVGDTRLRGHADLFVRSEHPLLVIILPAYLPGGVLSGSCRCGRIAHHLVTAPATAPKVRADEVLRTCSPGELALAMQAIGRFGTSTPLAGPAPALLPADPTPVWDSLLNWHGWFIAWAHAMRGQAVDEPDDLGAALRGALRRIQPPPAPLFGVGDDLLAEVPTLPVAARFMRFGRLVLLELQDLWARRARKAPPQRRELRCAGCGTEDRPL